MSQAQRLPPSEYPHSELHEKYGPSNASTPLLQPVQPGLEGDGHDYLGSPGHPKQGPIPTQRGAYLAIHPLSTGVLIVWVVFIGAMIWLLEKAVSVGHRIANKPWKYDALPDIVLTVFSQAHGGVTSFHLARLAISGLQSARTSPKTWAELFWTANKGWDGPIGIGTTIPAIIKMRVRVSLTFILFTICSIITIFTPSALTRAYHTQTVDVVQDITFRPNVTSPTRWGAVELYTQLGLGKGMWNSGKGVFSTYNATTYIRPGTPRVDNTNDLFFSGDVQGRDAKLPGIRINGSCGVDTDERETLMDESLSRFTARCQSEGYQLTFGSGEPLRARMYNGVANHLSCSHDRFFPNWRNIPSEGSPPLVNTVAGLAWFSAQNTSYSNSTPPFVQGVVKCTWSMNTGIAMLDGRAGTFTSYEDAYLGNATGGEPPTHPLFAALGALGNFGVGNKVPDIVAQYVEEYSWMLRVGIEMHPSGPSANTAFTLPTLEEIATRVSIGVAYMASAMNVLSTNDDIEYPAKEYVKSSAYVRSLPFAIIVYILFALWFGLLGTLTALMYRPTFGSELDSYVVSRLLVGNSQLVHGSCCGDVEDNSALKAPFYPVGDSRTTGEIGHVAVGGQAPLIKRRLYG